MVVTILLNYDFRNGICTIKKLIYADVLSRIIPNIKSHLEETVFAATNFDASIKNTMLSEKRNVKYDEYTG